MGVIGECWKNAGIHAVCVKNNCKGIAVCSRLRYKGRSNGARGTAFVVNNHCLPKLLTKGLRNNPSNLVNGAPRRENCD